MSERRVFKVADLFCGAGGASKAVKEAVRLLAKQLGYDECRIVAINHWDVACATYAANFPGDTVKQTGVQEANPLDFFKVGELDALIGGPECTEFSSAAGGKPKDYQYRPTPWCMLKWAEALRPRFVLVENVPEFEKRWPCFPHWFAAFESLGYASGRRVFCAADYGDPTTRRRLFMQFVLPPLRVVWPEPTHAEEGSDLFDCRRPWVPAWDIIDWSLKGRWLDEMPGKRLYGGLPLSPKTLARIYAGLEESGLEPVIAEWDNLSKRGKGRSARRPLTTITGKARHGLATAHLVKFYGTSKTSSLDRPAPTITGQGQHLGLAEAFVVPGYGERKTQKPRVHRLGRPMPTVCASSHHHLVEPFLIHTAHGKNRRSRKLEEPMPTVSGNRGDMALVSASLLGQHGGGKLRSLRKPAMTVTADGALSLVEAFLVKYYGTAKTASIRKPLPTVTARDRFALVCPEVVRDGERFRLRIRWRILHWRELAAAQGFPKEHVFYGKLRRRNKPPIFGPHLNKTDVVKQIGNAWPHHLGRAIFLAMFGQRADVGGYFEEAKAA